MGNQRGLSKEVARSASTGHTSPINLWGFPGDSDGKASACDAGDPGFSPWVVKIPCRRKWQPTPVFLPRKFHGLGNLVGYSPRGRKESDRTEQLYFLSLSKTSNI